MVYSCGGACVALLRACWSGMHDMSSSMRQDAELARRIRHGYVPERLALLNTLNLQ